MYGIKVLVRKIGIQKNKNDFQSWNKILLTFFFSDFKARSELIISSFVFCHWVIIKCILPLVLLFLPMYFFYSIHTFPFDSYVCNNTISRNLKRVHISLDKATFPIFKIHYLKFYDQEKFLEVRGQNLGFINKQKYFNI